MVLSSTYDGKKLNSPNDLVYKSDGALYFTDPPFGLPKTYKDPRKELPLEGVFMVRDGQTQLVAKDISGPNGLAFLPDEKFLYVSNWDEKNKIIMRYEVQSDGTLLFGKEFFTMNGAPDEEALDVIQIDKKGNLFVSGPGGIWIISPTAKMLGIVVGPQQPSNFAWGDEEGKTLYITARTSVYRIRLKNSGNLP